MKRKSDALEEVAESQPKAKRPCDPAAITAQIFTQLKPVQEKLIALDDECIKEQLKIQRQFASKMRSLYTERQKLLVQIPKFWGSIIYNLPLGEYVFCDEDEPILNLLEELDVEDHIDDKGSYKLTFKFSKDVNQYFSPASITRTVTFPDDGEPQVSTTPIKWVDGKSPVDPVLQRREQKGGIDEDDVGVEISFFEWLQKEAENFDLPAIGELLRRNVWQNPIDHFLSDSSSSSENEEDEGEDEDDEGAGAGAAETTGDSED